GLPAHAVERPLLAGLGERRLVEGQGQHVHVLVFRRRFGGCGAQQPERFDELRLFNDDLGVPGVEHDAVVVQQVLVRAVEPGDDIAFHGLAPALSLWAYPATTGQLTMCLPHWSSRLTDSTKAMASSTAEANSRLLISMGNSSLVLPKQALPFSSTCGA